MVNKIFKLVKGLIRRKNVEVIEITDFGLWDSPFSGNDLMATINGFNKKKREEKKRIPIQPIDIIHDFEKGVDFPKEKIKEAIADLEIRINFMKKTLKQDYTSEEERALNMLKARLKYPKYSHLFKWKTTTAMHIKGILDKYDLDHKDIKYYVRKIPQLAIQHMQVYGKLLSKVSKNEPKFSIIAPTEYFKDPKAKTDPILLAESPFGTFYYILTAWDKEISKVSELLDGEELVIDKNGNGKVEKKK